MMCCCVAVATVIVTSPETQNVMAGMGFMLSCNATAYPLPSIEWRLNDTTYNSSDGIIVTTEGLRYTSSILTVSNATANDTGEYQCVASNGLTTDTQNATITVQS